MIKNKHTCIISSADRKKELFQCKLMELFFVEGEDHRFLG